MDHEGNLTHASIPSIRSTKALPIDTLHPEGSLVDTRFPSDTSTSELPKATLHHAYTASKG